MPLTRINPAAANRFTAITRHKTAFLQQMERIVANVRQRTDTLPVAA